MDATSERRVPMNGRRAQAARNDRVIVEAARAVFIANPEASIASVAERAGVGMSALYRRYSSKEELLRRLAGDALQTYMAATRTALADDADPWSAFVAFMKRALEADSHSLTLRLAGSFTPTPELQRTGELSHQLTAEFLQRVKAAGVIRADVEVDDLYLLLELLAAVHLGDERRTQEIRLRYLQLILDGLRDNSGTPLPGPPPNFMEISQRWDTGS